MRFITTERFRRSLRSASIEIQHTLKKQLLFLLQNQRHPSLRVKKYDEGEEIWQARVNKSWRFYFIKKGDTYYLLDITEHPK